MTTVPISVGIPTFARGLRIFNTLQYILDCDPQPAEIIVHIDQSDGQLERELKIRFPSIHVLSSQRRVGPGGGRHRCIHAATNPFFASFDDDSWPVDPDFFAEVTALFERYPNAAALAASVYYNEQTIGERVSEVKPITDYTGCGYAIRIAAYRETTGHIDRYCPYSIEEGDICLQLHALEMAVLLSRGLRVVHDTQLSHHSCAEIVAGTIQNVALRVFLRYPVNLWPRGFLQVANTVLYMMKQRRLAGIAEGLLGIPAVLFRYSAARRKFPAAKIRSYLDARPRLTA